MNILSEIEAAGLIVSLAGDQLKITNPSRLAARLKNLMIANKPEIIKQLSSAQVQHDVREQIETRHQEPTAAIKIYRYRVTDKPNSELTVITHDKEPSEIKEGLLNRYGARLIAVYEQGNYVTMTPPTETKH